MTEPEPKINAPEPRSAAARASPHMAEMDRLTKLWAEAAIMQGHHPRPVVCLTLLDAVVRIMTGDPPMSRRARREIAMELYAAADKVAPPPEEPAP